MDSGGDDNELANDSGVMADVMTGGGKGEF